MKSEKQNKNQLGKIQNYLFPIHKHELSKFIPLFLVFFCISFNYALIRVIKDSFVMGEGGAEAIYYLKAYGVTPIIILFTILYSFICKYLGRDGRFNSVIIYLVSFFLIFLIIILPNITFLRIDNLTNQLFISYPYLKGLWSILRNWHTSLFYIHAELWGSYALVAFWTLANDITNIQQSGRFYSFLAMAANIGSLIAGLCTAYVFKGDPHLIIITFIVVGIIAIVCYNSFSYAMKLFPKAFQLKKSQVYASKSKIKLSLKESFSFLSKSKYLMLIAILVLSYNMCIALLESLVKSKWVEYAHSDKYLLSRLGGLKLMTIGATSILFSFIATALQRRSWKAAALFTPVILFISFIIFFTVLLFESKLTLFTNFFNIPTITFIVIIGTLNVVITRTSKYTFFEPSKESAYIPLDEESKIRGKAAVDGVGSRLGKGLSSLLLTMVFFPLGNGEIKNCRNYIACTILIILIVWVWATLKLNSKFKQLIKKLNIKY